MRVLVVGATGLIGSAVVAKLLAGGHQVVAAARRIKEASLSLDQARWLAIDITRTGAKEWIIHLGGIDAVVNCAGILQDAPGESLRAVHETAVSALAEACEKAGVRRLIHISAIGVDRETPSEFSRSKLAGDRSLAARDLDWVVLRPSVVTGRQAFGGSALFRGLAALPVLPVLPQTGPLQVVQLDDVVETVSFFISPDAPARLALELAGPERLSLTEVVRTYRRWLGWRDPPIVHVPAWLAPVPYWLGDFVGVLGWRPPMRSTATREIVRGAVGNPGEWMRVTGIRPRSLSSALAVEPAGVQERWFAPLYFLKPVVLAVLAVFWIITGLLSIGPGYQIGVGLMQEGGAGPFSGPAVIAGGLADLAIGVGIAFRRSARIALWAALALSLFYVFAATALLPRLWIEPLGPLMKIWPIMTLNFIALAILRNR